MEGCQKVPREPIGPLLTMSEFQHDSSFSRGLPTGPYAGPYYLVIRIPLQE